MPDIFVQYRRRFHALTSATARRVAGNAWEITIRLDDPALARLGTLARATDATAWDGTVFLVGDVETEGCVGSGAGPGTVTVTAWG